MSLTLPSLSTSVKADFTEIYLHNLFSDNGAVAMFTAITGATINSVTLQVRKNCESCNCDDDTTPIFEDASVLIGDAYELTANELVYKVTAADLDEDTTITDGIYNFTVTWNLTVDGDDITQTLTVCAAVINTTKCAVIELLLTETENAVLVPLIESISYAVECGDCCKACTLYSELQEQLENNSTNNCKT